MTAMATTAARDVLMPRQPGGMGRGLLLALLAHVLLVVALAFSVNWHSAAPDATEAELWAAVPQMAAPRAAEPPAPQPPPTPVPSPAPAPAPAPKPAPEPPAAKELPDAQIAIERERRDKQKAQDAAEQAARKLAEKKAADEAQRKAEEQAEKQLAKQQTDKQKARQKQVEALAARLEAQREANLKRIIGEAGGSAAPNANPNATAAKSASPSADYIGRIKGRIRPNVSFPNTLSNNPAVEIEVRVAPDGHIMSSRVVKASGAPEWDDAVLRAIEKTEVLPRDENGRVPPLFTLVYRPRD